MTTKNGIDSKQLCCPDCTPVAGWLSQHVMGLRPDLGEEDQARTTKALLYAVKAPATA